MLFRSQRAREEEATARRQNGIKPPAAPIGAPAVGSAAWREARAAQAGPAATGERPRIALAPRSAPIAAESVPAPAPIRVAAPAPVAAPQPRGPPVVVAGGAKPSWREREAARLASGGAAPEGPSFATVFSEELPLTQTRTTAPPAAQSQDGARQAYRPPGAGGPETPRAPSGGAYRPPTARAPDSGEAPPRSRW